MGQVHCELFQIFPYTMNVIYIYMYLLYIIHLILAGIQILYII